MDWREEKYSMSYLIAKLYRQEESHSDIVFHLPDGSTVPAHKLILAIASPYFEAQFYGLLASDHNGSVEIKDVDSNAFRKLLDFIYNSGPLDWDMDSIEYWDLLHAAHMYLVPGLVKYCNENLSDFMASLEDNDELVAHVNRASQLYIYEGVARAGVLAIKDKLQEIIPTEAWLKIQENILVEIVTNTNNKIKGGDLFKALVNWCNANTITEQEAIKKYKQNFQQIIFKKNINESELQEFHIRKQYLEEGSFEKLEQKSKEAQNPVKSILTVIEKKDFLDKNPENCYDLWVTNTHFVDVNIDIKIYQKISEGVHVPRGKFGILLETIHTSKDGADKSCITERVSVKMVAKKADGTVVKSLLKPIEDSFMETSDSRTNIFVLSKNKDERMQWSLMEIVVIIDRRPKCHINAISEENFATTVCSAPTVAYLEKAQSFNLDIGSSIQDAISIIADKMKLDIDIFYYDLWVYLFSKGYVSNLRCRRALPNDYWSAKSVEDFMRCKIINFPNSVSEAFFKTWIIGRRLATYQERHKKNLFVCRYNVNTREVIYKGNVSLIVQSKIETLQNSEFLDLGYLNVTENFFKTIVGEHTYRIFLRRIFPIQNEIDEEFEKLIVSEAKLGEELTHIDDCHVLVIQEGGHQGGLDFDKFIISKIREIMVRFEPRSMVGPSNVPDLLPVDLALDPKISVNSVLSRLNEAINNTGMMSLELFKCYSTKSMMKRPAEFPVDPECERNLASLLEWCKEGPKTIYYNWRTESRTQREASLPESPALEEVESTANGSDCLPSE